MAEAEGMCADPASHPPRLKQGPGPLDVSVGVGFVLLSALAFASTPVFVRLAYTANISSVSLVAFRCLIAAGVLWLLARLVREQPVGLSKRWPLVLLGALLFAPQMWAYFAALQHLDTSITVAIVYIYPALVVALIAVELRKVPRVVEMLLLGLGLCGVGTIVLFGPTGEGSLLGLGLALLTAVGYALYVFFAGALVGDIQPLTAASLVLLGAGASSVVFGMLTGALALPSTSVGVSYLALHGLLIVPVGLASYYAGLRRLGAAATSLVDTSQPAIATMIGVAILGERLAPLQGAGIAAIVLAVVGLPIITALQSRRKQGRMSVDESLAPWDVRPTSAPGDDWKQH